MKEEKASDVEDQDEETTKFKQKSRGKKRKRHSSGSSSDEESVLPENTLEVEKSLHASAIKNNLDDVSVKKILKKVVTNDHVLALVKLREEEESNMEDKLQPKLTRAKAKELMKASPQSAPWSLELTPIKHIPVKTRPEVKALIAQELPDDEDDEEYKPTHDDVPSDDDHAIESSSDVDSLPRTPVTPRNLRKTNLKDVKDGPFKVPQEDATAACRKLELKEEEATIALRTRSKLSLSSTSIEHIESSFVPPDDLPMADVDSLWNDFLTECLNPGPSTRNEDDDEADPEYNVAADPDANEADEEALENSLIKISKKELNDLVTELFSIIPEGATDEITDKVVQNVFSEHHLPQASTSRWEGKQEPASDDEQHKEENTSAVVLAPQGRRDSLTRFSIGKTEPQDHIENDQECNYNAAEREGHEEPDLSKIKDPSPNRSHSPSPERSEPNPVQSTDKSLDRSKAPSAVPSTAAPERPKTTTETAAFQPVENEPPAALRKILKPVQNVVCIKIEQANMLPEQVLLLQQQLRQHVQLAASNYLQLYVHPNFWDRARTFKEFLTSLDKMTESKPNSVVNVCNLKPAVELIASWEAVVSQDTPKNMEMVKFVKAEFERSRGRVSQNVLYVGQFPEMYMEVVANSTVFVYPYLLPSMPYRDEPLRRRNSFLQPVDELVVLGLEQFLKYVEQNPKLYRNAAAGRGWGLQAAAALVAEHLLPWIQPRSLLHHIRAAKRLPDKDNPIAKFFVTRRVEPLKHKLLPFNPKLTLYEQPEHELPRIWLRYLAKSSIRFKKYLYRRTELTGKAPNGVDLDINMEVPTKDPLPIRFSKFVGRSDSKEAIAAEQQQPKFDIQIGNKGDGEEISAAKPLVATKLYTVVTTCNGSVLVPLDIVTKTIETGNSTPVQGDGTNIASNEVTQNGDEIEGTKTAEISTPQTENVVHKHSAATEKNRNVEHCLCCILLRNICRVRQRTIVEYFRKSTTPKQELCCTGKVYPNMTNRLKLLLRYYKVQSQSIYRDVSDKEAAALKEKTERNVKNDSMLVCDDSDDDHAVAKEFFMRLTMRLASVRFPQMKKSVHTLFSKFDLDAGHAVLAAERLGKICDVDLVDIYKEFLGFLTADQADRINQFKDYFVQRCMPRLAKKIEEEVSDAVPRRKMLSELKAIYNDGVSSACVMCCRLLATMAGYPALARYAFSLFPHRHGQPVINNTTQCTEDKEDKPPEDVNADDPPECNTETPMDYEADDSSSEEESEDKIEQNKKEAAVNKQVAALNDTGHIITVKNEKEINTLQVTQVTITKNEEEDSDSSNMDMLIMSEDESFLKNESTHWKREEDKVILEVLKKCIAPEERKDKTILEVIEEKQVLTTITKSLSHKSMASVKERMLYLLQILLEGD